MTLLEIKNLLISHFISSATFNIEDDLESIKLSDDEKGGDFVNHKGEIVKFALKELEKAGLVAEVSPGIFVLQQPLTNLPQSVVISPFTALMIADLVNQWMKISGEQKKTGYVVNKMQITNQDIVKLCSICHTIFSSDEQEEDPDDQVEGRGKKKKV